MDAVHSIFELVKDLNLSLDREQIGLVVDLCENGVNPEVIVTIVKELHSSSQCSLQK